MTSRAKLVKRFCFKPANEEARRRVRSEWNAFVRTSDETAFDQFAQLLVDVSPADVLRPMVAAVIQLIPHLPLASSVLAHDPQSRERVIHLVQATNSAHKWLLKDAGNGSRMRDSALVQEFQGEVKAVDRASVMIELEVGDDIELRQFRRTDLRVDGDLQQGAPVVVRCELRFVPPRKPMTDAEVRKWKKRHAWASNVRKKAKRAKSLLPDEEDEDG